MRVSQRIQLMVTFLSLLIHDDLLVKDMVGSVEIHNHTLIWRRKENTGNDAENDKIPLEKSPFVSPLFESVPPVEPPRFQCWWRRWFRTCDGLQSIAPYLQNRMCFFYRFILINDFHANVTDCKNKANIRKERKKYKV